MLATILKLNYVLKEFAYCIKSGCEASKFEPLGLYLEDDDIGKNQSLMILNIKNYGKIIIPFGLYPENDGMRIKTF